MRCIQRGRITIAQIIACVQIGSIEGFTSICEYSIYCNKPNFRFDPNPENSRGEWGPGADTARYGLDTVKQDGGIIYAEDGRAIVAFRSNDPKRIRFRYFLKSFEEPNEDLRECICHYKSGDLIVFPMKLPHKGKYTLEMYAKVVDRTGASTRWRCTPRWSSTQRQVHARDVRQGGRANKGKYTLEMYAKVVDRGRKKRGSQKQKKGKGKEKDKKKDKNQKNSKDTKGRKNQASDDEDDNDDSYESICNYLVNSLRRRPRMGSIFCPRDRPRVKYRNFDLQIEVENRILAMRPCRSV